MGVRGIRRFALSVAFALAFFACGVVEACGPGELGVAFKQVFKQVFGGDVVCANATTGQVPTKQANGSWAPGAAGASYTGTPHQVIVTGSVLSAPQDLDTTSRPTFAGVTLGIGDGFQSTLLGYQTGSGITSSGINNALFGYQAGKALTNGSDNAGFGTYALYSVTDGYFNAGFGSRSLQNSTGDHDTAVGQGSLFDNISGNYNSGVGYYAGRPATAANANISGSYNTYLGAQTGSNSATQRTNTSLVGYGALSTSDNQVVLGNSSVTSVRTSGVLQAPAASLAGDTDGINIYTTSGSLLLSIVDGGGIVFGSAGQSVPMLARNGNTFKFIASNGGGDTSFTASDGNFSGKVVAGTSTWSSGAGTPEGAVTAPVGSLYSRTNGGAGTSFYVKESGAGNTGWVAK